MPNNVLNRRLGRTGRLSRSHYAKGGAAFINQNGGGSPFLKIASNPALVMGGHKIAFAGWLRFFDIVNPNQHVMTKVSGAAATDEYFLQVNSTTTLRWGISDGSIYSVVNWSAAITNGVWYFIYGDWDGATLHLNVNNGTPVTLAAAGPINTGTSAFRFGADGADGTDTNAYFDAWAVWKDRVLTAAEQTLLYHNGTAWRYDSVPASLLANLVAWWDFDGKANSLWVDSFGTNDLTDVNNNVTVVTGLS